MGDANNLESKVASYPLQRDFQSSIRSVLPTSDNPGVLLCYRLTNSQSILSTLDVETATGVFATPEDQRSRQAQSGGLGLRHRVRPTFISANDVFSGCGIISHNRRIWLLDLAKEHPGIQCDGYDISTDQYPASGWLPPNVSLSTLDIHKPIPTQLRGQYDVVHVGLLVLVVEHDDPGPLLDNLMALLSMVSLNTVVSP